MAAAKLPPFALEFLGEHRRSSVVVRRFHNWLRATHRPLLQMTQPEIDVYLKRLQGRPPISSQRQHRSQILCYFDWLHEHGLLAFDPRCAWPRANFPLPSTAEEFVRSLEPILRKSTVRTYRTALRQFHIWLHAHDATIDQIDRDTAMQWTQWLHHRGLHPSTRLHVIQQVRGYLRWLDERNCLRFPADTLLRSSDLPKLPQYLPRPLPPDLDAKLQRRLNHREDVHSLGLLLMRRTGLRVGELIALPYRCLHTDPNGNQLLKVPLGKLNTERLVPLDKNALKVLRKLRFLGRRHRTYLIERAPGQPVNYSTYRDVLRAACCGLLEPDQHITSHQLRHTYATALLAGGMSLVGVMRLLGHKDYRMTLRYAAITDETVLLEYASAIESSAKRYHLPSITLPDNSDPARQLLDIARHLRATANDGRGDPTKARNLAVRLRRLAAEIKTLERHAIDPGRRSY